MHRIEEPDVIGTLRQLVWQEAMHRLMIIEAIMLGHIRGPNPCTAACGKAGWVKNLTIYGKIDRGLIPHLELEDYVEA